MSIFDKIFGDYSAREVKRIQPTLQKVLSYEDEYKKLSDDELRAKTPQDRKSVV